MAASTPSAARRSSAAGSPPAAAATRIETPSELSQRFANSSIVDGSTDTPGPSKISTVAGRGRASMLLISTVTSDDLRLEDELLVEACAGEMVERRVALA